MLERLSRQTRPPVREVSAAAPPGDAASEVGVGGHPEIRFPHVYDLNADADESCQGEKFGGVFVTKGKGGGQAGIA